MKFKLNILFVILTIEFLSSSKGESFHKFTRYCVVNTFRYTQKEAIIKARDKCYYFYIILNQYFKLVGLFYSWVVGYRFACLCKSIFFCARNSVNKAKELHLGGCSQQIHEVNPAGQNDKARLRGLNL